MWVIVQKNTITSATYITCSIMPEWLFLLKLIFFFLFSQKNHNYENPHFLGLILYQCTLWLHDLLPGQDQNQSYTRALFEGPGSCWLWKTIGWLHHPSNLPKHDEITKCSRKEHWCVKLGFAISTFYLVSPLRPQQEYRTNRRHALYYKETTQWKGQTL